MVIKIEREYYPIDDAAKILGCSTADLIHLASTGIINVCILLNAEPVKINFLYFDRATKMDDYGNDFEVQIPLREFSHDITYTGLARLHGSAARDLELNHNAKVEIYYLAEFQNSDYGLFSDIQSAVNACPSELECSVSYNLHKSMFTGVENIFITNQTLNHLVASNNQFNEIQTLSTKERNSLLNIIGALHETLLKHNANAKGAPLFKNQSALINHLEIYDGYQGLSKSNLEKVFPEAAKYIQL